MAGPRVAEGWGGNRVYNGSAWMELYWILAAELYGDPTWSLTPTGKIPNQHNSVLARFQVQAIFDANTLDNNNTFKMSPGSSFPNFSGSVSIPTVKEATTYNDRVLIYPTFGSAYSLRAICSLTGIERVPGTTSFDRWVSIPARAWATPDAPTVVSSSVNTANKLTLTISGHQTNAGQDKYWERTAWTIWRSETNSWSETHDQPGNLSSFTWDVAPNQQYYVGARSWNEDGGVSAWTPWEVRYSKPAAPSSLSAARHPTTSTTVQLSWTNNAPYADGYRVYRWSGSSWVNLGLTTSTTFNDTNQPLSSTPQYRVEAKTPDNTYSDPSLAVIAPLGYTVPNAPTNPVLTLQSAAQARLTFSGHQTNPAVDKYWAGLEFNIRANTGNWVAAGTSATGDITSFDLTTALVSNSRYMARVRATNAAGPGAWATSGYVFTKPPAPSDVTAARFQGSDQVVVNWTDNAAWSGFHTILRSTNGGPFTEVGTANWSTTTFTDTLEQTSYASYMVVTKTPSPVNTSGASAPSPTVPTTAFEKDKIPGIEQIFAGPTKVFRVMAGDQQIWLG